VRVGQLLPFPQSLPRLLSAPREPYAAPCRL
jgi:hypothetical protein